MAYTTLPSPYEAPPAPAAPAPSPILTPAPGSGAIPAPNSGAGITLPGGTGNSSLDAYTQASLGALNQGVDYTKTPTYQTLLSLLGPRADGGLNPNLMAQYGAGSQIIGQQTAQGKSLAMSGAQGRGLGQSSIEAQGVENAEFTGRMADSSLLASLYGQQNSNTLQLAQDVYGGSTQQMTDLLGIYDSAGTSAANISMYSAGLQEALAAARSAGQSSLMGAGIGALGSIGGGLAAGAMMSDARLKTDVRRVARIDAAGADLYRFRYKSGLGLPDGEFAGFMAHELVEAHPEAVVEHGGYLHVKAPFLPVKVGD